MGRPEEKRLSELSVYFLGVRRASVGWLDTLLAKTLNHIHKTLLKSHSGSGVKKLILLVFAFHFNLPLKTYFQHF